MGLQRGQTAGIARDQMVRDDLVQGRRGGIGRAATGQPGQPLNRAFAHLAQQVLTAIRTSGKVEPNFEDGLRCQIVLDAARESAAAKRWVEL